MLNPNLKSHPLFYFRSPKKSICLFLITCFIYNEKEHYHKYTPIIKCYSHVKNNMQVTEKPHIWFIHFIIKVPGRNQGYLASQNPRTEKN